MFLFDILKRSLLSPVQVYCAKDTDEQPSTSQKASTDAPHQKCRPRKPKVVLDSDHCKSVKGKQGKTGAGVTGAGGGVAGGGTGDYETGGGDDRGGGADTRSCGIDKKIGSKSAKSKGGSPTKKICGYPEEGGEAGGRSVSVAKDEPKSKPAIVGQSETVGTAIGSGVAGAKSDSDDAVSSSGIVSGSGIESGSAIESGSNIGSGSGIGGMGGKIDNAGPPMDGKGFSGGGIIDDSGLCLTVDGQPPGSLHPGLLRHIHNGARNRLPSCFEGAFVCVKQSPIQKWILGHTISFSSVCPGGYKLLSSYVDTESPGQLPYFVMEAAPGGQVSCEARVPITRGTKATVFAQIANAELYSFETIIDTCFDSFTASLIAVNREFVAMHYLQAVTNELCLGAEVSVRSQGSESSSISAAARYMNEVNFLSGTLGSRGLDMCYARAINPALTVAAMLEIGFAIRNAVATLGYEWHASGWTVRASMDSDGLVGCTLHRSFPGTHANFGCAFSALLNHPNDKFRMGFGITGTLI